MRLLRIATQRLRSLMRRSNVEAELHSEIELHIEQLTREYMAGGMTAEDARAAARREFGNVGSIAEQCRDTRRVNLIEDLFRDLSHAWRMMLKSPGFTLTAVLSLALGIGANTAIFSLVQRVVLELLPIRDPESLVRISRRNIAQADSSSFSYPMFRDLQESKELPFDGFFAYTGLGRLTMVSESGAEAVMGELVSGNYFDLLGVRPALGRVLSAEDDRTPGAHPVAVLSYHYWERRFGRDPGVLNKVVRINGHPFTIIGVSAAGFDSMEPGNSPDVRVPINMVAELRYALGSTLTNRGNMWLVLFGRIRPGVTYDAAANALLPVLYRNYPYPDRFVATEQGKRMYASERMQIFPGAQGAGRMREWFERPLWALMAMVGAVLLLAIVNIAHLLLARGSARERELSLRAAIGASRGRLIRQLLAESLLLALMGGVLGLVIARLTAHLLLGIVVSDSLHSTLAFTPKPAVLAFNFGIAIFAGVLFGLIPALSGTRINVIAGIKRRQSGETRRHIGRKLLISFQAALSIMLLIGAGLFLRSIQSLRQVELGYRQDHLLQFGLNPVGYPPERILPFFQEVRERIGGLRGVRTAILSRQQLIGGGRWTSGVSIEGFNGDKRPETYRDAVSSGYFSTLGIPLLAGREFTDADRAGSPKVAIINEAFAKAYFAGQNPVGKRIGSGESKPDITIVGVVKNAKYTRVRESTVLLWYVPYEQLEVKTVQAMVFSVRTTGEPTAMIEGIRREIAAIDKNLAMFAPRSLESQIDSNLMMERLLATLSVFFGLLAAVLAAIGLFGVLSWSVSRREREIGIRMALGGEPGPVAWEVIREVVVFTLAGLAVGTGIAMALSGLVEKLLFGIKPNDGIAIAGACLVMAAIASVAAFVPARRAAAVSPSTAFRAE